MVRVEVPTGRVTLVRNDLLIEKTLPSMRTFCSEHGTPPWPLISGISEQLFAQFFTALLTSMRRRHPVTCLLHRSSCQSL